MTSQALNDHATNSVSIGIVSQLKNRQYLTFTSWDVSVQLSFCKPTLIASR